jgi:hypothetical protein
MRMSNDEYGLSQAEARGRSAAQKSNQKIKPVHNMRKLKKFESF